MTKPRHRYFIKFTGEGNSTGRYNYSCSGYLQRIYTNKLSRVLNNSAKVDVEREALNLTNGCCAYCNKKLYYIEHDEDTKTDKVILNDHQWDHFYPASDWMLFIPGNVVVACSSCNNEKSDRDPTDYWKSRQRRQLSLRFKTREEWELFKASLEVRYRESNTCGFSIKRTSESEGLLQLSSFLLGNKDIAEAMDKPSPPSNSYIDVKETIREIVYRELENLNGPAYAHCLTKAGAPFSLETRCAVKANVGRLASEHMDILGDVAFESVTDSEFTVFAMAVINKFGTKSSSARHKVCLTLKAIVSQPNLTHLQEPLETAIKGAKIARKELRAAAE